MRRRSGVTKHQDENMLQRFEHEIVTIPFRFVYQLLNVLRNALSFTLALQASDTITTIINDETEPSRKQLYAIIILILLVMIVSYIIDAYVRFKSKVLHEKISNNDDEMNARRVVPHKYQEITQTGLL